MVKKRDLVGEARRFGVLAERMVAEAAVAEADSFASRKESTEEEWNTDFDGYLAANPPLNHGCVTLFVRGDGVVGAHVSFDARPQLTVAAVKDAKEEDGYLFSECHHGHARAKFYAEMKGARTILYYRNEIR